MTSSEEWRTAAGFPDYEVSDRGRVRSIDRYVRGGRGGWRFVEGVNRKAHIKDGYVYLGLRLNNSSTRQVRIHRLVAATFIGPCPAGMEVLHINGVRDDNRPENLRYGTRAENVDDTIRHGHHPWVGHPACRNGHEYTPENTRVVPGTRDRPKRRCLTCYAAVQARYQVKKKARRQALKEAA